MTSIILICAIVCLCLYVIFSMMIVHELSKRGVKINFFWLRLLIVKYIQQYKKITLEKYKKLVFWLATNSSQFSVIPTH